MRRFFISGLIVLGLVAGVILAPATALAAFGIDPGKVYIDNLYPGARAEFPITIYNQNDYEATFVVRAREPDYTAEDKGYDALPHLEWVTATPGRVIILVSKHPIDSNQGCYIRNARCSGWSLSAGLYFF